MTDEIFLPVGSVGRDQKDPQRGDRRADLDERGADHGKNNRKLTEAEETRLSFFAV